MVIAASVLSCLVVMAGLTSVDCTSKVILAGSDTPVWLADRPNPNKSVVYTRLESGLVKKAIDHWQVMKKADGFPVRTTQPLPMSNEVVLAEPVSQNEDLKVIPLPKLTETTTKSRGLQIIHPSILLVLDYDYFLPMTSENEAETIKQRIIYALAFWWSVRYEFHRVELLKLVEFRISGIVITRNRKASPYINNSEYYYSLVHSLTPMLDYWTHLGNAASEFQHGSYDIIAHLTDSYPYREADYGMYPGIASNSNPCAIKDGVSGVIVYDDLAFGGLHNAVEKMSNVFGDDSVSWKQYIYYRKDWTATGLEKIQNTLKNANCMSAPKEYYPLGEPVQPILAGELLPRAKQCEAHGFNKINYHCWNHDFFGLVGSTCEYLKCTNTRITARCSYSNPTLDGTFCNLQNTAVCIAGKCLHSERPSESGV